MLKHIADLRLCAFIPVLAPYVGFRKKGENRAVARDFVAFCLEKDRIIWELSPLFHTIKALSGKGQSSPAQPEFKKGGGLNFFVTNKAYANRGKFSFRQIVTNYKGLAITSRIPAVVHAADA